MSRLLPGVPSRRVCHTTMHTVSRGAVSHNWFIRIYIIVLFTAKPASAKCKPQAQLQSNKIKSSSHAKAENLFI